LEWCSAAEGSRWQTIMKEVEKKRLKVSQEEVKHTQAVVKETKVPSPRNPRPNDENTEAQFSCLRCGHQWEGIYRTNMERSCPGCRSNSVRWLRKS